MQNNNNKGKNVSLFIYIGKKYIDFYIKCKTIITITSNYSLGQFTTAI